jgi:hypothetical protein
MTVKEKNGEIDRKMICCEEMTTTSIESAFASDLMSDFLTVEKENLILKTRDDFRKKLNTFI